MKIYLTLLCFVACLVVPNAWAEDLGHLNWGLAGMLKPMETYTGVLVDATPVTLRVSRRGLLTGLTAGTVNFVAGTRLGTREVKAYRYIVRFDSDTTYRKAEVVTIIQTGDSMIQPGVPVFVTCSGSVADYDFYVRVVEAKTPDAYLVRGLEETRLTNERRR